MAFFSLSPPSFAWTQGCGGGKCPIPSRGGTVPLNPISPTILNSSSFYIIIIYLGAAQDVILGLSG